MIFLKKTELIFFHFSLDMSIFISFRILSEFWHFFFESQYPLHRVKNKKSKTSNLRWKMKLRHGVAEGMQNEITICIVLN